MDKQVINNNIKGAKKSESPASNTDVFDEITRLRTKIKKLEEENRKFKPYLNQIRQLEKALSESEEKYKTLLKSSSNAIMIIHHGTIVFSNLSGLRALGYSHQ